MAKAPAELSSISSALDELMVRVAKLAEDLTKNGDTGIAYELFEVERLLTPGARRLSRVVARK